MDTSTRAILRFIHRHGTIYSDGSQWRASGSPQILKAATIIRLDAEGFTRIVFTAMGVGIGRSLTIAGMNEAHADHLMPRIAA